VAVLLSVLVAKKCTTLQKHESDSDTPDLCVKAVFKGNMSIKNPMQSILVACLNGLGLWDSLGMWLCYVLIC